MDKGFIVLLGRGGRESNILQWCLLVTILVILVEREVNYGRMAVDALMTSTTPTASTSALDDEPIGGFNNVLL